jgi:hypothetical protein
MINLVLDDLRGPTVKGFDARLKICSLPLYFNGFIAFARTGTTD